jgi:hypothetical protein
MSRIQLITFVFAFVLPLCSSQVKNATISAWQYCHGCKITVDLYAKQTVSELKKLDKLPKGLKKELDAAHVLDYLCDNIMIDDFDSFAKFSCIKVLDEYRIQVAEQFSGSFTVAALSNKKELYEKKKNVSRK